MCLTDTQKNKWQLYEQTQSVITATGVHFTLLLECAERYTMNCGILWPSSGTNLTTGIYMCKLWGLYLTPPRQINNSN